MKQKDIVNNKCRTVNDKQNYNPALFILRKLSFIVLFIIFYSSFITSINAQTDSKFGINPGAKTSSAVFELESTTKGFLMPRLTTAQMNTISSPVTGLMIFNTSDSSIYLYRGTTSGWKSTLSAASPGNWTILGNSGTTPGTNFIGTTDAQDFIFKANNSEKIRITSAGKVGIGVSSPSYGLSVSFSATSDGIQLTGNSVGGTSSGTGFVSSLGYNTSGNKQMWFGDPDGLGNSTYNFVRYVIGGPGSSTLDAVSGDNTSRRKLSIGVVGDSNSGVYLAETGVDGKLSVGTTYYNVTPPTNSAIIEGTVGIGTTTTNATLDVSGSIAHAITTTSVNLTLDATHYTVIITANSPIITLPAASTCTRRIYVIANQTGGRTISSYIGFNGSTSTSIPGNDSMTVQSNGTSWYRIQ